MSEKSFPSDTHVGQDPTPQRPKSACLLEIRLAPTDTRIHLADRFREQTFAFGNAKDTHRLR